jgi:voltage-gated potassium channel Kch
MKKITLADRLRYEFDNTMARGTVALVAWLGIISAIFIVVISLVISATGISQAADRPDGFDFFQLAWMSLMRTIDPGNVGGDTGAPAFLFAMLIVGMGGLFLVSTFIGVLTSGIENRLEELRKGRSFVIENGHTLILGWSPQVFAILSELIEANANQARACIVILADKDKVEMEDGIRSKVGPTRNTRIVCRSGSPLDPTDLEIANPHHARSIVVLAPETDDPDTHVIKAILALTNKPHRKPEPYHIVTEIRDPKNMDVVRMIGRDEVQPVLTGDLISRITVQTCRQSGLSVVYTELLNFGGDEIYFKEEPALVGKTFGEALFAYEDSAVIGVKRRDAGAQLKPPMETRLQAGDQIIAIAEDDDKIKLSLLTDLGIDASAIQTAALAEPKPERTLVLGWNRRGQSILRELDEYVAPGSETLVVADTAGVQDQILAVPFKNQTITFQSSDTTDRRTLEALDIPTFQHIIALSYADALDPQEADARTLITLLHLRDMSDKCGKPFAIVSEMLDVRNRQLAEATRADDFIVSDQLVSLLLSQISENKSLGPVFDNLFDPEGSEIYLKPVENYVRSGVPIDFYTVLEAARCRNEVALGYRLSGAAHAAEKSYGVVVNPDKSNKITFEPHDRIIVLAEN